jgi:hypothetical protein
MRRVRVRVMFIPPRLHEPSDTISLEQSAFYGDNAIGNKNALRSSYKVANIFCPIWMKLVFCLQFCIMVPNIKLRESSPSADTCGGTDGHDESNKALLATFANVPKTAPELIVIFFFGKVRYYNDSWSIDTYWHTLTQSTRNCDSPLRFRFSISSKLAEC